MSWTHGYHAEQGYSHGYYAETMPLRLHWAALMQDHLTPREGFRYLDAGCGQGLNLILAAAAHPDAEFVGLDFMPEHIAHGRSLAQACGLKNIQFIEADFRELADNPTALAKLGEFDYAVCHGITTWIAPVVRNALFMLLSKVLRPGGLFYNSYNTYPGWLSVAPFQHLVLLEQKQRSAHQAISAANESILALKDAGSALTQLNPALMKRLETMQKQDPVYLVQEYNNLHWRPVYVTEMVEILAAYKFEYLGTASLPEAFHDNLPLNIKALIDRQPTQALKMQLMDYALNQQFRRDLYIKGRNRPWKAQREGMILDSRFIVQTLKPLPAEKEPFIFESGTLKVEGQNELYSKILNQFKQDKGLTLGELRLDNKPISIDSSIKIVSQLMHGGWLLPYQEHAPSAAQTNKAIITAVSEGAPYKYLSSPRTGSALAMGAIDMLILESLLKGLPESAWAETVSKNLARLGQGLMKDGKAVENRAKALETIKQQIDAFKQSLPQLKRLGVM